MNKKLLYLIGILSLLCISYPSQAQTCNCGRAENGTEGVNLIIRLIADTIAKTKRYNGFTTIANKETPGDNRSESTESRNYIDSITGIQMNYIPEGEFLLGSDPDMDKYSKTEEMPQLHVYLDGYWIGMTEVTNGQYLKCVEAGVCEQNNYMTLYVKELANHPVTYVSNAQAEDFCSWIGGRLPTEFEWEKAARGTKGNIYPWGDEEPTSENDLANIPYYVNEDGEGMDLFPVGSFPLGKSPYGLMDMAGNVWEWTSTFYNTDAYHELKAENEPGEKIISNPTGSKNGCNYVIKGGSAASVESKIYPSLLRAAGRSYVNLTSSYFVGFRCVVTEREN